MLQIPGLGRAELGATWLHGLDGNPIYETALSSGLMQGHERKIGSTSQACQRHIALQKHCMNLEYPTLVDCLTTQALLPLTSNSHLLNLW